LHRCSLLSCSVSARASLARRKRSIPAFLASLAHDLILHPSSQARDPVQSSNQGAVACGEFGLGSCNQPITGKRGRPGAGATAWEAGMNWGSGSRRIWVDRTAGVPAGGLPRIAIRVCISRCSSVCPLPFWFVCGLAARVLNFIRILQKKMQGISSDLAGFRKQNTAF